MGESDRKHERSDGKGSHRARRSDGRLRPGGTVVEYTAGTTGISLAFVCAARGYALEVVFSDAFSEEKRRMMQAFGAHITDVPSDRKKITEGLIKAMISTAAEISLRGPAIGIAINSTTEPP